MKNDEKKRALKESRAAARKAHFAAGGTVDTWIMKTRVKPRNQKAEENKKACRESEEEKIDSCNG